MKIVDFHKFEISRLFEKTNLRPKTDGFFKTQKFHPTLVQSLNPLN
jgi:hypothetical protein